MDYFLLENGTKHSRRNGEDIRINSFGNEDGNKHSLEVYSTQDHKWYQIRNCTYSTPFEAQDALNSHKEAIHERYFESSNGFAGTPDAIYEARKKEVYAEREKALSRSNSDKPQSAYLDY